MDISEFILFNDFHFVINMAVSKIWAGNTYCYEEVCNNFKQIHKIGFMNKTFITHALNVPAQSCVSSVTNIYGL